MVANFKMLKKEAALLCILVFSSCLIYLALYKSFYNVDIGEEAGSSSVLFIMTFGKYIYMVAGLFLMGFTVCVFNHMRSYLVGKLFSIYLLFITLVTCLIAVYGSGNRFVNSLNAILLIISNVVFFHLVGRLTLITKRKLFRRSKVIYCLSAALLIGVVAISEKIIRDFHNEMILLDYAITIIVLFINLVGSYKNSTVYSRRQILWLGTGTLVGTVIFIISRFLPMFAVVAISDSPGEPQYAKMQLDNLDFMRIHFPLAILVGIVTATTFLLIKREYISLGDDNDLKLYIGSTGYLLVANTLFRVFLGGGIEEFVVFNMIVILPLFIYGCKSYKQKAAAYDSKMLEVLENERQRLSVFLHDEVLQSLIAVSYTVRSDEEKEKLSEVIGEIRGISQELYPTIVEDLGVDEALKILLDEVRGDYNVDIEYQYTYPAGVLPEKISLTLYRTVKELVNNALKHACCTYMKIAISEKNEGISCVVSDNGKGFRIPEDDELIKAPHMGIYTIKKQIAGLGGSIRILSDTKGSEFQIYIPMR